MNARRVALVRHPAPAIAAGFCYGRLDVDLAPGAEAAIAAIVDVVREWDGGHVWTSPALRCARVADAIGGATGWPVRRDPRLLELDFGAWEGCAWDAIPRSELDRWAASPLTFATPGGESGQALACRVAAFHRDLEGGHTVVVSHGGPLKILAALLHGRAVDLLAPAPPLGSVETIILPGSPLPR